MKKVLVYSTGFTLVGFVLSSYLYSEKPESKKSYGSGFVSRVDSLEGIFLDTDTVDGPNVLLSGSLEKFPQIKQGDHLFFVYDSLTKKVDTAIIVK